MVVTIKNGDFPQFCVSLPVGTSGPIQPLKHAQRVCLNNPQGVRWRKMALMTCWTKSHGVAAGVSFNFGIYENRDFPSVSLLRATACVHMRAYECI